MFFIVLIYSAARTTMARYKYEKRNKLAVVMNAITVLVAIYNVAIVNGETQMIPTVSLKRCESVGAGNETQPVWCGAVEYKGVVRRSATGIPYAAFLGLPYGKVGQRFKVYKKKKVLEL